MQDRLWISTVALFSGALLTSSAKPAIADEPLPSPRTRTISSGSKTCLAVSDAERGVTTAYRIAPNGKKVEMWSVPGWYGVAALSANCEYLVTGYEGMNLIPVDFDRGLAMLAFYRGGKMIRQVRLDQIVRDLTKLQRTVSHFYWGNYLGVQGGYLFRVQTVDRGEVLFDMRTGTEKTPPRKAKSGRGTADSWGCSNELVAEYPSPDGALKIVVFGRSCGATTGFSTHASVLPAKDGLPESGGNVLACDAGHGAAPTGPAGGPEVRVRWMSPTRVRIEHHARARLFKSEPRVQMLAIEHGSFD